MHYTKERPDANAKTIYFPAMPHAVHRISAVRNNRNTYNEHESQEHQTTTNPVICTPASLLGEDEVAACSEPSYGEKINPWATGQVFVLTEAETTNRKLRPFTNTNANAIKKQNAASKDIFAIIS